MQIYFAVAGSILAVLAMIYLVYFAYGMAKQRDLRRLRTLIRETRNQVAGAFHHSQWLSAGTVTDILHNLYAGHPINIQQVKDYNTINYLSLNGFSASGIQEILENLDELAEEEPPINVGNVTGIGDDILPSLHQENARLIRVLMVALEAEKERNQELNATCEAQLDRLHELESAAAEEDKA